jgi:hypothetical protein
LAHTNCVHEHVPHVSQDDDITRTVAHHRLVGLHRSPNKEKPMNRRNIKRVLVSLGITAGILTATAGSAAAAMNHSEPTLRSR